MGRLAAIPTVVAIKLPLLQSGDIAFDIADFRQAAPTLSIGYSGDWGCKEALLAGADGWYSVAAGLFPAQASALTAAAMKGDRDQADRHDAGFATLWELFRAHGSLRLTDAQPPRPLLGADENLRKQLASVLSTVELILQIRIAVSFTLHFATVATKFRPD